MSKWKYFRFVRYPVLVFGQHHNLISLMMFNANLSILQYLRQHWGIYMKNALTHYKFWFRHYMKQTCVGTNTNKQF